MRGGLRPGGGRPKGAKTERTRAIAEQVALTGLTPLEVMMEAMRHYQAIGNRDKAVAIAKDAAPYMHPRLHAVAGADLKPKGGLLDDGGPDLVTMARKVALAFRLTLAGPNRLPPPPTFADGRSGDLYGLHQEEILRQPSRAPFSLYPGAFVAIRRLSKVK